MKYTVAYTPQAVEALKKLSPATANLLYSWAEKNLNGCEDPRATGTGRKRGGRWRYKVGAYRLVCEIGEDRIVILAITSDEDTPAPKSHDRRGQAKRRAPSVFLKSSARQPVKMAALLVVTAMLAFAFVSRGAEWLLVSQEVERLEGFYQATGGVMESSVQQLYMQHQDASELVEYLEENPYVDRVDVCRSVSAVLPDYPNYASGNGDNCVEDVFFYGTLQGIRHTENRVTAYNSPLEEHPEGNYRFSFVVDKVLVGTDREEEFMIREGGAINLINAQDYTAYKHYYTDNGQLIIEGDNFPVLEYQDLTDVAAGMEVGQRYLLRGSIAYGKPGVMLGQTVYVNNEPDLKAPVLQFKPLTGDGLWYLPVAEGGEADFSDPRLAGLEEEMKLYDENQHAVRIFLTDDMELAVSAWSDVDAHLIDGRWITPEDAAQKRPVCVAFGNGDENDRFRVGDVITMKLRDLTSYGFWQDVYIDGRFSGYGILDREEDLARLEEIEETSVTIDVEVVGVYGITEELYETPACGKIFIPSTLVPETFSHYLKAPVAAYDISFALTGPDVQKAFLEESVNDLGALGFRAYMPENSWENFVTAAVPMVRSSLYNAVVFAAVMAAGLAIVTVVYFYMRRREMPIARAVGVPAKTCVRQIMSPLLLLAGLPGIALGSAYGWVWTARNAGDTLSALAEFGQIDPDALPLACLAAMAGIAFALLAGMTLLGAVLLVRRPILELLQGAARAAVAEVSSGKAPAVSPVAPAPVQRPAASITAAVRAAPPRKEKLGLRAGLVARFVWRQAVRARLKTGLTILLAAGFTIGLAAIQLAIAGSQERIDWLYENTPIEAELVRNGEYSGSSIRRDTVEALRDTGYITDFYLEASTAGSASGTLPYSPDWNASGVHIGSSASRRSLLAFEDEETFLSKAGSGSNVTITYHAGWDGSMFAAAYTEAYDRDNEVLFPVVVSKELYDEYGLEPGSAILIFSRSVRPFEVAGYYEGVINGGSAGEEHPAAGYNGSGSAASDPVLLPLSACQTLNNGRLSYSKAHVTLDPSLNRQLDEFEAALTEIAGRQGIATLRAVIWDEELRQAVAPLEGGIQLMRVLYPVTLVLSILCAAGVSVLFIMTSAKEAAILRVQGTTKLRAQAVMGLQQTLTCFVGLVVGLASVLLYVGSARPAMLAGVAASSVLCAVCYLIAAAAGAAASSAVVTSKNPLELLQVKE